MENNVQNELQRRRQEMFKNMGVANAGKVLQETTVAGGGVNSEMAAKIAAIKSGAARGAVSNVIKAIEGGTNGGGPGGVSRDFKPLQDNSKNKFAKEQVNPEYSQKVENFDLPGGRSSELSAIESMFGSDGPSRGSSRQNMGHQQFSQNPLNTELHLDDIVMPSFNPHAAIQQKAMKQQQQQQQNNMAQSPYLKFASDNPIQQDFFEDVAPQGQQQGMNFNMNALQMMMETIAKGIAEKTIRTVLNEYTEQQKSKVFIEKFDKERNIIKTSDGKYYRVTQVEPKKK